MKMPQDQPRCLESGPLIFRLSIWGYHWGRAPQPVRPDIVAVNNNVNPRFDNFENRIDRMEASADLINYGAKPTLEEKFAALAEDEEIEKELEELKASQKKD